MAVMGFDYFYVKNYYPTLSATWRVKAASKINSNTHVIQIELLAHAVPAIW